MIWHLAMTEGRPSTPAQREAVIMSLVGQWGYVTRGAVSEHLPGYSGETIRLDFRRLVAAGDLEKQGDKRGAFYVAPVG